MTRPRYTIEKRVERLAEEGVDVGLDVNGVGFRLTNRSGDQNLSYRMNKNGMENFLDGFIAGRESIMKQYDGVKE